MSKMTTTSRCCQQSPSKKKKRMAFLPVEFNNVKIDALLVSGAYINSISEKDVEKIQHTASRCIVNKAPPFKVQYADAEQEQPLATYTITHLKKQSS